jgi:hypothetical protein
VWFGKENVAVFFIHEYLNEKFRHGFPEELKTIMGCEAHQELASSWAFLHKNRCGILMQGPGLSRFPHGPQPSAPAFKYRNILWFVFTLRGLSGLLFKTLFRLW